MCDGVEDCTSGADESTGSCLALAAGEDVMEGEGAVEENQLMIAISQAAGILHVSCRFLRVYTPVAWHLTSPCSHLAHPVNCG